MQFGRLIAGSSILTLVGLVAACGGSGNASTSKGHLSVTSLTVGYYANPNPERIAQEKGWFNQALGLKVSWKPFQSGAAMIAGITSGAIQFACEDGSPPVASAIASGLALEVFWVNENSAEALVVRNSAHIDAVSQLKGQNIGTIIGSTMYFSFVVALQHAGVPLSGVNIVNSPIPDLVSAYQRGNIAGAYVPQPALSQLVEDGSHVLIASTAVAKNDGYLTFDSCITTQAWATSHGDVLQKWVDVENRAVKYYDSDPAASYAAIAKEVGISVAEAKQESSVYAFPTAAQQDTNTWLGTPGNTASSAVAKAIHETAVLEYNLKEVTSVPSNTASAPQPKYVNAAG